VLYTDDIDKIYIYRRALMRWSRIEGLYGGDRYHKQYAAWLRAHLVRIGILLPTGDNNPTSFSISDIETAFNVLVAIEEGTIRWMAAKPGQWSMKDWGEDSGSKEAAEKVNRIAAELLGDTEAERLESGGSEFGDNDDDNKRA
jgi:hypothetical protein